MDTALLILLTSLALLAVILQVVMLLRPAGGAISPEQLTALRGDSERVERTLREEQHAGRAELAQASIQAKIADLRKFVGEIRFRNTDIPIFLHGETRTSRHIPNDILRELHDDLGVAAPRTGDLSPWAERGVMLLNRVLTVRLGEPGSHRGIGWEQVTSAAIDALVARPDAPLVAILWGRDAQSLTPALPDVPIIATAHPSPMSADRGFFGSRPFSRANELLEDLGADPIDWTLP